MRDYRDAKAMAQSLREAMSLRHVSLTNAETLELVSKILGFSDWNTLAAFINADRDKQAQPKIPSDAGMTLPVLPIRDWVPFPTMQIPLWIKRPKTIQALKQAFSHRRELLVVAQRNGAVDEPAAENMYDIGAMARVLDLGPPSDKAIEQNPVLAGSTQILVQTQCRVAIKKFSAESGSYKAEFAQIDEGAIMAAPELIETAMNRFDKYAADHNIAADKMWPPFRDLHDPGRVADMIAQRLPVSMDAKQAILATLDSVTRLENVIALLGR
jgi:ATP-dependent Lon protease